MPLRVITGSSNLIIQIVIFFLKVFLLSSNVNVTHVIKIGFLAKKEF